MRGDPGLGTRVIASGRAPIVNDRLSASDPVRMNSRHDKINLVYVETRDDPDAFIRTIAGMFFGFRECLRQLILSNLLHEQKTTCLPI
ncbi:MAG: hypothetical protein H6Q99_1010 [Proteobacteria bacterium]|nr:hypothetical protein [Pseudomonadota bacterium]